MKFLLPMAVLVFALSADGQQNFPPITQSPAIVVETTFTTELMRDWISIIGCELNYFNSENPTTCFDPYSANFNALFSDVQSYGISLQKNDPTSNCQHLAAIGEKLNAIRGRISRLKDRTDINGDIGKIHWQLLLFSDAQFGLLIDSELDDLTTGYCVMGEKTRFDWNYLKSGYVAMMRSSLTKIQTSVDTLNTMLNVQLPYSKWDNGKAILDPTAVENALAK